MKSGMRKPLQINNITTKIYTDFAKDTVARLDRLKGEEYAKCYVDSCCQCFSIYGGIITSSSHSVDFFSNIVKYWDDPDSYLNSIKNRIIDKDAIKNGRDYELNFVLLLKKNKND